MPSSVSIKRASYAFLLSCLFALVTSPVETAALSNTGAQLRHAHHPQRMVKVRQPRGIFNNGNTQNENGNGTGNGTGTGTGTGTGADDTQDQNPGSSSSATTQSQSSATSATSAAQTATTSSGNPLDSILGGGSSTTSATTSAAATSTTSAATSTTAAGTTSMSLNLISQSSASSPTSSVGPSTLAIQSTIDALPTSTSDADNSNTSANTIGKNTMIAIVVIASCVGGAAAIWTLIRKWKLGTSARFDNRLNPIEWAPEMEGSGSGLPGGLREKDAGSTAGEKHKRAGSAGSHGSFHSSDIDHNGLGRNVTGNGNMFADQNPSTMPPPHDFTAGPAPAYTGGGYDYNAGAGYVDLQRSNSGSRSQGADLTRGPSLGHNAAYGAGPEYAAYGQHDAYGQDAYGGYDAYHQQNAYAAPAADPYAAAHAQQQYGAGYQGGRY